MRIAASIVFALALSLALAACGEETIDASAAEDTVSGFVSEETGFEADDVSCPEDVPAEVDETFECTFTGPEGPYVASVRVTEIDGEDATFFIRTRPEGANR